MPLRLPCGALLCLSVACRGKADDTGGAGAVPEPVDLPADPAETGVPVGVRTFAHEGLTVEVWYPAPESLRGVAGDPVDFDGFIPAGVQERVGGIDFPAVPSIAVRDAPVRVPEAGAAYPVIVFAHGFGGMRVQSIDFAAHLASRGYVVLSADHIGRTLGDVVPCLFSPPAEGCNLSGFGSDPAVDDIPLVLGLAEQLAADPDWHGALDMDTVGMSGHSAGGGTTEAVGDAIDTFDALLSMAAPAAPTRDVPTFLLDGTCDGIVPSDESDLVFPSLADGTLLHVVGAGHLAFADLCALGLTEVAEEVLAPRDDLNPALYAQLLTLASDGCPGAVPTVEKPECAGGFLPLERSAPIVRASTTLFFDAALRGEGPGLSGFADPDTVLIE